MAFCRASILFLVLGTVVSASVAFGAGGDVDVNWNTLKATAKAQADSDARNAAAGKTPTGGGRPLTQSAKENSPYNPYSGATGSTTTNFSTSGYTAPNTQTQTQTSPSSTPPPSILQQPTQTAAQTNTRTTSTATQTNPTTQAGAANNVLEQYQTAELGANTYGIAAVAEGLAKVKDKNNPDPEGMVMMNEGLNSIRSGKEFQELQNKLAANNGFKPASAKADYDPSFFNNKAFDKFFAQAEKETGLDKDDLIAAMMSSDGDREEFLNSMFPKGVPENFRKMFSVMDDLSDEEKTAVVDHSAAKQLGIEEAVKNRLRNKIANLMAKQEGGEKKEEAPAAEEEKPEEVRAGNEKAKPMDKHEQSRVLASLDEKSKGPAPLDVGYANLSDYFGADEDPNGRETLFDMVRRKYEGLRPALAKEKSAI